MKQILLSALLLLSSSVSLAASKFDFNFKDADVAEIVKAYATATGHKVILDPQTRGKATIHNPGPLTSDEAFEQMSIALAKNSLAVSKQGDALVISSARNTQRSLIGVSNTLPSLKPERMHTWVIQLKNVTAEEINRQLRILTSKDGELVPMESTNQLVVTDWTSNLHRVAKIIAEVDIPKKK